MFEFNRRLPGKILIALEVCWVFLFSVFVIWFETADDAVVGIRELRYAVIFSALHAGAPYTTLHVLEKSGKGSHISYVPLFWVVMSVFSDLWSVMDVYLHITTNNATMYAALKALVTIPIILSGLSAIWYLYMLAAQPPYFPKKRAKPLLERKLLIHTAQ